MALAGSKPGLQEPFAVETLWERQQESRALLLSLWYRSAGGVVKLLWFTRMLFRAVADAER